VDLRVKSEDMTAQVCQNTMTHEDVPEALRLGRHHDPVGIPIETIDREHGVMAEHDLVLRVCIFRENFIKPRRLHACRVAATHFIRGMNEDHQKRTLPDVVGEPHLAGRTVLRQIGQDLSKHQCTFRAERVVVAREMVERKLAVHPFHLVVEPVAPLAAKLIGVVRDATRFAGRRAQLLPLCLQKQIAVMAFSPLCQGFLSGKYTRDPATIAPGSRFDILPTHGPRYFTDRNFRILDQLAAKADALGIPLVRLAVAWAMTHPAVTTTLIGARTPAHIDNGLEAEDLALGAELHAEMSMWK